MLKHVIAATLVVAPIVASGASAQTAPAADGGARSVPELRFLNKADVAPQLLVPAPPRPGSREFADELAQVRAVVAAASPERAAQADFDGKNEDASAFNAAVGKDLAKLPITSALLKDIQDETEVIVDAAKLQFALPRPYQIDTGLKHCGTGTVNKAFKSYPSGHAGFGYSVGWALARLMPDRAPQVLARADDYAFSREVCGVHFHMDTQASRVIGTVVAERMLADPRLAPRVAAARAELAGN